MKLSFDISEPEGWSGETVKRARRRSGGSEALREEVGLEGMSDGASRLSLSGEPIFDRFCNRLVPTGEEDRDPSMEPNPSERNVRGGGRPRCVAA
jgi:hypothetical protein